MREASGQNKDPSRQPARTVYKQDTARLCLSEISNLPSRHEAQKPCSQEGMRFAAVSICIASRTTSLQMPQSSALTCAAVTVNSCRPKPPTRWLCSGSSHRLVLAADSCALAGSVSSGGFIVLDMFATMSVPATWFDIQLHPARRHVCLCAWVAFHVPM